MRIDHRSEAAKAYRHLYNTSRWKRERLEGLRDQPLCVMCKAAGKVTAATVRNHIKPHKGDETLFWDRGNHESLCKTHHDGSAQKQERRQIIIGCDTNGIPTDPNHPWSAKG